MVRKILMFLNISLGSDAGNSGLVSYGPGCQCSSGIYDRGDCFCQYSHLFECGLLRGNVGKFLLLL